MPTTVRSYCSECSLWWARAPSSIVLKNSFASDFIIRATLGLPCSCFLQPAGKIIKITAQKIMTLTIVLLCFLIVYSLSRFLSYKILYLLCIGHRGLCPHFRNRQGGDMIGE